MENNKTNSIKLWVVIELYPNIQNFNSNFNLNYGNYELDLSRQNYRKNNSSPSFIFGKTFGDIDEFNQLESRKEINNFWSERDRIINKLDNIRLVGIYSSLEKAQSVSFQHPNTKILEPFEFCENN